MKKEKIRLEAELQQQRLNDAKLKRKIESLEEKIHSTKEENNLLRNFNEVFGDENDKLVSENEKLLKENEFLKKEVSDYKKFRIPEGSGNIRPNRLLLGRKRSKSCPTPDSSDEPNAAKARVRYIFNGRILLILANINRTLIFLFRWR